MVVRLDVFIGNQFGVLGNVLEKHENQYEKSAVLPSPNWNGTSRGHNFTSCYYIPGLDTNDKIKTYFASLDFNCFSIGFTKRK